LKAHSCNEGPSVSADTKEAEALQMSSDTKYFTPSAGEIEIWMAKGERIEKIKAARIIILLNFMLYFKYFQKHVNIKLQL